MADEPPVLKYASGSPDASWLDEGVTSFSFAPRPVTGLLVLLGFITCGLFAYGAFICWLAFYGPPPGFPPEYPGGPVVLIGLAPLAFGVWYVWRTFRHLNTFGNHPVTIEFTPAELRVRNPISWGDAPRSWPWGNLGSVELKSAGRTATLHHAYRFEFKEQGVASAHVIYFTTREDAAVHGLRSAIDATSMAGSRRPWM